MKAAVAKGVYCMKQILIFSITTIILLSCSTTEQRSPVIGKEYYLYGYNDGNPFMNPPIAKVIVVDVRDKWVQYRWAHDSSFSPALFYRTEKEFFAMVDRYNKKIKQAE